MDNIKFVNSRGDEVEVNPTLVNKVASQDNKNWSFIYVDGITDRLSVKGNVEEINQQLAEATAVKETITKSTKNTIGNV